MRIALDAMGSDRAPAIEVEGAIGALRSMGDDLQLVVVGDRERIDAELGRYPGIGRDRIEVVHAPQRIEMGESPAQAIRRKPDSSIVVGLNLHKRREVDAFISAGSTGAVMAGSLVILGPLPGVDRPPVGAILPTSRGHTLLIDAGANIDTRPQQRLQFAHLGTTYAQDLMGIERPRIGLLNIGEEPEKGDEQTLLTYQLLRESTLNFVGNIEGRDIIDHKCDVLVSDGFAGNVLLKFYESVTGFILDLLRKEVEEAEVELDLSRIFRILDYTEYGGAPLLGVNGVVIICHGGSPPKAVTNAIRVAAQAIERDMTTHMQNRIGKLHGAQGAT
ncbi:MAG: phosphate acyltransferase PlsX [Gemmatimonas sp.]|nr:phosphate acyltransferase PlsX [Gemmatimonas sp.]